MVDRSAYDVVIVGAGPAGSTCAHYFARLGVDVCLLDCKTMPRPKACGDGIGPRAISLIADLGLSPWLESGEFYRIDRLRAVSHTGKFITSQVPATANSAIYGYVVDRRVFDKKLADLAVAGGATLLEGFKVDGFVTDNGRYVGVRGQGNGGSFELRAKLIVAAYGSKGNPGRELGGNFSKSHAVGVRGYATGLAGLESCGHIYFSDRLPKGYGWIFPTGDTTANIGVGTLEPKKAERVRRAFDEFVHGDLHPVDASGATLTTPASGSVMKMDFGRRPSWLPGLAFIGDAAGLVSPINGEGISHAMESGRILAEQFGRRLTDSSQVDAALRSYATAMSAKFTSYFRWGRFLNRTLSNQNRMDRLISKARNDKQLATLLIGVLSNVIHPRELAGYRALKRIFL